jgi:hypothetical protein
MTPNYIYYFDAAPQNSGTQDWPINDVTFIFQWKTLTGTLVSTSNTGPFWAGTPIGSHTAMGPIWIQAPANSGVYTLTIDMQRVGESSLFHNREAGRPWFTLDYRVCVGDVCPKLFLPIIMKNAS